MKITVLIPAYNEHETILEIIQRAKLALEEYEHEIIVIDDASQDSTVEIAGSEPGVKVMVLDQHQGKGAALKQGLAVAQGEIIIIQDADLEYDPSDYPVLLKPILQQGAKVVYGSRILGAKAGKPVGISNWRFYWGGRLLSWLTSLLYKVKLTDESTGYKVFLTEVLKQCDWSAKGFDFCPEVTAKLLKKNIDIVEVPISYMPRTFIEGKKISWQDGWQAIKVLVKQRFT